jgi:hypothetical protein
MVFELNVYISVQHYLYAAHHVNPANPVK